MNGEQLSDRLITAGAAYIQLSAQDEAALTKEDAPGQFRVTVVQPQNGSAATFDAHDRGNDVRNGLFLVNLTFNDYVQKANSRY